MSINTLYRRHIAATEHDKGLLQALLVLGDKIEIATGTHPDAAWATFDTGGNMVLNANNYKHWQNRTQTGDLIEELIDRLGSLGGGGGGSTPPEILRSATDLSGAVPSGYTYGYNYTNGNLYTKNNAGDWQRVVINTASTDTAEVGGDGFGTSIYANVLPPAIVKISLDAEAVLEDAVLNTNRPQIIQPNITSSTVIKGMSGIGMGRIKTILNDTSHLVILQDNDAGLSNPSYRFDTGFLPIFLLPGDSATFKSDEMSWKILSMSRGNIIGAFDIFSDFYGGPQPFGVRTGSGGQHASDSFSTIQGTNGIYRIDTGTSANGWANLGYTNSGYAGMNGPCLLAARIAVEADLSGQRVYFGIHNGGAAVPNNGFWLQFGSNNGGVISIECGDGSPLASTTTTELYTVGDYVELAVYLNAATDEADYFIRFKGDTRQWFFLGRVFGTISVNTITPGIHILKESGTAGRKLHCDWMGMRVDMKRHG